MAISPAQVQRYLEGIDYPASKRELIEHARGHGAGEDVLSLLEQLPERRFNGPTEVSEAIGQVE